MKTDRIVQQKTVEELVETVNNIDLENVRRFELNAAQELARRIQNVQKVLGVVKAELDPLS
jgi:hypothetical protein